MDTELKKNLDMAVSSDGAEGQVDVPSPAKCRQVRIKTDLVVMPLITISMTLAFLDKNALAYAAIYGLKEDTNLKKQEYSWLGSIFYFGYLFMEFPNLWIIYKFPAGKYVGACLMAWGISLGLMSVCHNFAGLAVIRFLLGAFEASILPCLILVNSTWYRREEQPLRTAFWANTFAGVFGGILSYAIGRINGSLSTWKYIFIIYGAFTLVVGIAVFFLLPNSPAQAWFLNDELKSVAVLRLASNQTATEASTKLRWGQIGEALKDTKYWCLAIFFIAQSITNAGITNFNPLIISGYGFSQAKTVLMATPQAAVAMVAQASMTAVTLFVPNMRCIFWVISSAIAMVGAIMVKTLDPVANRDASLAGVYLMGFYNVSWVMALSLQSSNVTGMTKKSFVSISAACFYAIGNIVGPQFFLESQRPHYSLGIGAMLCGFAVMMGTGTLYFIICAIENKRRDRKSGAVDSEGTRITAGLDAIRDDLTDKENRNFRYTY
ncbi:major facilitator superfamily domain-containing protein [Fusarium solani]|uniref:Major facilitator superfamily domain-containing protein n=1 Tax=Fusarium solani TaxID=169388 RepID=A0A9P9GUH2_FUSSL|nr:major facilitator superfamily domain-containing protein [Fusarium solani]KAH7244925.1 major facilitator superfamily domain-containing protein [Fusarium solani]